MKPAQAGFVCVAAVLTAPFYHIFNGFEPSVGYSSPDSQQLYDFVAPESQ
jgi:hypothetical protein